MNPTEDSPGSESADSPSRPVDSLPAYGRKEAMATLLGVLLLLVIGLTGNFQQKLERTRPRESNRETGEVCEITVGGGRTVFVTREEARHYHFGEYTVVALGTTAFLGALGTLGYRAVRRMQKPPGEPIAPA